MWNCNGAGYGHWFFGGGMAGFVVMILIIILVVALIFRLIKSNQYEKSENLDKYDSLMILKMKFAKGEINEQEYQHKKEILTIK